MLPQDDDKVAVVVDDDDIFRSRLCRALADRSWHALGAASSEEALPLIEEREPDLILVDLRLATGTGLDVIAQVRQRDTTAKIIVLTGYGSIATALAATRLGADDYVGKPVDADQILTAYDKLAREEPLSQDEPPAAASLARVEWEHIQRVLSDCEGNISKASRVLGIHRRSLQRKLEKYPPVR